MRIFKTKAFAQFARKHRIGDEELVRIVTRMRQGAIDANLGGNVYKQRIARAGQGKSGGFRSIIFYLTEEVAYFVMGFAKSDLGNIGREDLKLLKNLAKEMLRHGDEEIRANIRAGEVIEVEKS